MAIDARLNVDASVLLLRLGRIPDRVHGLIYSTMNRLAIQLQGKVKDEKLTGQVLHVRTGTLRRSINQEVTDGGSRIDAVVGTNIEYAHIHEYGFHGTETVRQYLRRRSSQVRADLKEYGDKLGKIGALRYTYKDSDLVVVRSHQREVNMPERSFLRSALREMAPQIARDIEAAAAKGLQE